MSSATDPMQGLKDRMRATWMAGDFGMIARLTADAAAEFVGRLPVRAGAKVLDVACGTGNLAIPAARLGAHVTGVDIASNLLEQARARAAAEGLPAAFEEGDAEALQQSDESFDVVMTMFGAMFAPRQERVARELTRVCRPGGVVAMANWTPEGFVGQMFRLTAQHVPPPEGIAPPVLWGKEDVVRERLSPFVSKVETARRRCRFDLPLPVPEVVAYFRKYFGPTQLQFEKLDAAGQAALAADLESLWAKHNQASGNRTVCEAEYLEVIATR